jgi:YVTN family beta-propeller protein
MTSVVPSRRVPTVAGVTHHSSLMAMRRIPLGESPDGHDRMDLGEQLRTVVGAARRARGESSLLWHDFEAPPVDLFVTLLELGFRCWLRSGSGSVRLVVDPDGSVPRDGWRDRPGSSTHSLVCTDAGRIYAITTDDRVAILDASSRCVLDYVQVGAAPQHVTVSSDGRWLYTANFGSDDVTIVDLDEHLHTVAASAGRGPILPTVGPDGTQAWVPSRADSTVAVVRSDGSTVARIRVGLSPHDIEISPDGRWAYQPNQAEGTVTVIDTRTLQVEATVAVGMGPCHVAFSPDSAYGFVANTVSDEISVVKVADHEVVRTLVGGSGTHVPLVTPDGRWLVAADFVSDDIFVWDAVTFEPVAVIPVGRYPHGLALSPDSRTLVVSHTGGSAVSLVDMPISGVGAPRVTGPRLVREVDVRGAPGHIAFDPEGRCAFVACERAEVVAVLDLEARQLVDIVAVGAAESAPSPSPDT